MTDTIQKSFIKGSEEEEYQAWLPYKQSLSSGLEVAQFSTGLQETPFVWKYYKKRYKMKCYSGFIGVSYDHEKRMLVPVVGYLTGKR
jgi:hypothetical protein